MIGAIVWGIFSVLAQQPAGQDPKKPDPKPKQEEEDDGGMFGKGVSLVPIPFFATNRNVGPSYGLMPVFMFENDKGEVTKVLVPKYEYFAHSRSNYSVDFFMFPDKDSYFDAFGLVAAKDDQRLVIDYRDNKMWGGDWAFYGDAMYKVSNSQRFFGLGHQSDRDQETNYLVRDRVARAALGYHVFPNSTLFYQQRVRKFGMSHGHVHDLPYTKRWFEDVVQTQIPGFDEGTILHEELRLSFDNRDLPATPTRGYTFDVWASLRHYWGHEGNADPSAPIWGGGFDASGVWSMDKENMFITAAHIRFEVRKPTFDKDLPFIEMCSAGGNWLRGFGDSRYYDYSVVFFSVEERIAVWTVELFGVKGRVEIAPFLDIGKVMHDVGRDFFTTPPQFCPGIAFRGIVPPFVVGRVEFGYGEDGITALVGLDYPY